MVGIASRIQVSKLCDHLFFSVCCAFWIPVARDCVVDVTIAGGPGLGDGLQSVSVCVWLTLSQLFSVFVYDMPLYHQFSACSLTTT